MSDTCLFCKIIAGHIPADIVYQDDDCLAFKDIHPKASSHVLLIPKQHVATLNDLPDAASIGLLMERARHIAQNVLQLDAGYRLIINIGKGGGQEVFHLHIHIMGGKKIPAF